MTEFENILFDLDGTIMDTSEGITAGVEYAINKLGLKKLDAATKRLFIGPPLRASFQKYCEIDEETAERALAEYRIYYGGGGLYGCTPYEGIENLFASLEAAGKTLYVATAKPTDYSVKILEKWGLCKYFKKVIGASFDKSLDSKDKIIECVVKETGKENTVMIGDTYFDILGAHKNGIKSIGVLYGFGDAAELAAAKPEFTAKTVAELSEMLLA